MPIAEVSSHLLVNSLMTLLGCGSVAVILAVLFRARRQVEAARAALQQDMAQLNEESRNTRAALAALSGRIERLAETLEAELRHAAEPRRGDTGYEIAIRLARGGAGPDQLMNACGMSRREAEVVARLHGRSATAQAAVPRSHLSMVAS